MIFCDIFINTYNLFYFLEVEYNKYLQILATWYTYINDELSCMYKNTYAKKTTAVNECRLNLIQF